MFERSRFIYSRRRINYRNLPTYVRPIKLISILNVLGIFIVSVTYTKRKLKIIFNGDIVRVCVCVALLQFISFRHDFFHFF